MPTAKETSGDFKPAPEGTHLARCISVVSLGTQTSELYAAAYKVLIGWELPNETIEYGEGNSPMVVSKEYTLSLHKKATLRQHLESWRGKAFSGDELKGFPIEKVLGVPCLVNVIHKTTENGTFARVAGVSALPKGTNCPEAHHKLIHFEIEHGKNDTFKSLPEWIQKKIHACEEWVPRPANRTEPVPNTPSSAPCNEQGEVEEDSVPF